MSNQLDRQELFGEIVRLLEPFHKGTTPIAPELDISRDLNLDSLAVMDLMMAIEERFDISIPLNMVPEIQTVADLVTAIEKIRQGA
jgi:acyl carrier protein